MLLAGFIGGMTWQKHNGGTLLKNGLDGDLKNYQSALSHELELNLEQQESLKLLLYYYQQQRDDLFAQSLASVDGEWLELDRRFESLVYARVLDSVQRDRLADLRQSQQLEFTKVQR
ncbi:MAG: hypothetical protein ACI84O_000266 [Myxococcota bacterium]|jgi:hypothetical protein